MDAGISAAIAPRLATYPRHRRDGRLPRCCRLTAFVGAVQCLRNAYGQVACGPRIDDLSAQAARLPVANERLGFRKPLLPPVVVCQHANPTAKRIPTHSVR